MKKIILLGAISLISFSTFAQYRRAKNNHSSITYSVKVGTTFANFTSFHKSSITSFYVGGTLNIPVDGVFSVQPGLTLVGKGGQRIIRIKDFDTEFYKMAPWYLEIPMNAIASFEAGPGKLFVGAGPYASVGLFGSKEYTKTIKTKEKGIHIRTASTESDIEYGKHLETLDFGLNFLLGYQLTNGLNVSVGYGLGLTNIQPNSAPNATPVKNSVFSMGLGFTF